MVVISATLFSKFFSTDACDRCLWLRHHAKLPYQSFPGCFSTLDRAGKSLLSIWVDCGKTPPWLEKYGTIKALIKPPHWSKFSFERGGLKVRGEADAIALLESGKLLIPDLKTAVFSDAQESILPVYAGQLNCYALAAEAQGVGEVGQLVIVYCQPSAVVRRETFGDAHYSVDFSILPMAVHRNDERVYEMCDRVSALLEGPLPSPGQTCKECHIVEEFVNTFFNTIQGESQ